MNSNAFRPKRKAGDGGETRHEDEKNIVSDSFAYEHDRRRTSAAMSTTAENSAVEKGERQDDNSSAFQPYWRDMTFIRRKLGAEDDDVESEQQQGENEAGHHSHANGKIDCINWLTSVRELNYRITSPKFVSRRSSKVSHWSLVPEVRNRAD